MFLGANIIISNCMVVEDRSSMAQDGEKTTREAVAGMSTITV